MLQSVPGFHMYFKSEYKSHQVMFVNYQNLVMNTINELSQILNFLGYILTEDVADCIKRKQEGLFHRKKPNIDQMKYYNAEQKVVLKALRDDVFKKIGFSK